MRAQARSITHSYSCHECSFVAAGNNENRVNVASRGYLSNSMGATMTSAIITYDNYDSMIIHMINRQTLYLQSTARNMLEFE